MAITKEKKQALVSEYVDLLRDSHAAVFVQLQGLTVGEVTDLRNRIREAGGKYHVVKNTLFRRALRETDMVVPDTIQGPLAVTFCPEDIAPVVKVVEDFGKTMEGRVFSIVGGIVEQETLTVEQARALSSLPTKETLFAQVLATINAPGTQLAGVIASGIRQVLSVIQARVEQLEGEAAA
ncbi:MAG: 50S ribosomal protein L10 [Anaerolineae bacterium]|nr:50S ribosomal protein L10 [Anaerolineae bacterium]